MESQSDEVVEIKRDDEECNHRIVQLFCHRNCTQSAQICEFKCKNRLSHDYTKLAHEKASIDEFKIAFLNLEQTSTQQTEHYIRQLNDIERHAIQSIAKKKAECLKDIKQFKNDLMRQTYTDLQSKFPHLYQKFKNQRFDTLNCNEVFWVMHTNKHSHSLKPSIINSKLVAILKKFQTFKDVSKNISPNFSSLLANKQKAKNSKIILKGQQPIIKVRQAPNLIKPDYSQDKLKEMGFLQRKKKDLEDIIKNLNGKYTELSNEISHKIYMKREKQNRMRVYTQIYQLKFQNINSSNVNPINDHKGQQSQSSQLSPQLQILHPNITQRSEINQEQPQSNKLSRVINAHFGKPNQESNKNGNQINEKQQMNKISQVQKIHQQEKDKDKNLDKNQEKNQNVENRNEVDIIINEANIGVNKDGQVSNNNVQNSQPQKTIARQHQQEIVKQQFVDQKIQPWMNKQLLEEMRKYGKSVSQGLKVENIDVLKSFSTVKLKSPMIKINPIIKRSIHRQLGARKPSNFNLYAMELFDSELKRKAQGSDKKT